ncbi:hypothetical protein L204_105748 [Cryptococcus depauperatus]|nr:hypothetical protein L204_06455 [Cryptococcus depauperatus CBS 7855]
METASHQGKQVSEPLLPLHIALGWIIIRTFPIGAECQYIQVYSLQFTQRILQIVAREVLEVATEPATFDSLRKQVDRLVKVENIQVIKRNDKKRARGQVVGPESEDAEKSRSWIDEMGTKFEDITTGCLFIDGIDKELRELLNYGDEEEPTETPPPLERHSPIGVFVRSLINILRKLSFDETTHLAKEVAKWCGVGSSGPPKSIAMWSLDRKSGMEDSLDKRVQAIQDYQLANSTADCSGSLQALRRFFDYQFPSSGRGQHQHALLNIAVFHYATGGLESARSAVDEAIRVSRTAGDRVCLQHCMSLSLRLQTESDNLAFVPGETIKVHQTPIPATRLPIASTPMDELWSVKAALDLGEPVHIAFRRIYTALGISNQTEAFATDEEGDDRQYPKLWPTGQALDVSAWYAMQAGLWSLLGSNALAEFHEDSAVEAEGDGDGALTVLLTRAQRMADEGQYNQALAMLMDISVVQGMSVAWYHRWARVVWGICERRFTMNNDFKSLSYLFSVRPSKSISKRLGPGGPLRELSHPLPVPHSSNGGPSTSFKFSKHIRLLQDHIQESLKTATSLQSTSAPAHLVLPHVLSAVQLSSELGLWRIYRFGVVILAECMMSMEGIPMAAKAVREIESIWPQLQASQDQEALARGGLCLAKAHLDLALESSDSKYLELAVECLSAALCHARRLESYTLVLEITSLSALVAQLSTTDEFKECNSSKTEYQKASDDYLQLKHSKDGWCLPGRECLKEIIEAITWVGLRASEGWQ